MKNLNLEILKNLKGDVIDGYELILSLIQMIELGFAKKQSRICYKIW